MATRTHHRLAEAVQRHEQQLARFAHTALSLRARRLAQGAPLRKWVRP